jgi:Zn-dependent alcohol dehydrogenase
MIFNNGSNDARGVKYDNGNSGLQAKTVQGAVDEVVNGTGIRFGIDKDGNYGYIKAGADTVNPFSSGGKFVSLTVVMGTSGTEARPVSFATRNDTNGDYFGDYETGNSMNSATMTFKKSGTYKILFRTAYRVTQSNCSLKHNDTYVAQNISGNTATAEYSIDAVAGDILKLAITNKTSGYGFQLAEAIVYQG